MKKMRKMTARIPRKAHTRSRSPKRRVLSSLLSLLLAAGSAQAGWVEDFYNDAAAQTSVTAAGVYRTAELGLVTGGRFVTKVPRKTFQLFSIDAPHLKAGCGGIDLYLGAFSIPSQEEFMSFLRSIGTALPGVAFQLALNAMAPELNETLAQYRDLLMEMSSSMGDSCEAAHRLLEVTGASAWLEQTGHAARNSLRASGQAEDAADALRMTKTSGSTVLSNVPERRTTGGSIAQASEMNLTWALLKAGNTTQHMESGHLELLMSLTGTTIYRKTGAGDDTTVRQIALAPLPLLDSLFGVSTGNLHTSDIKVYRCDTAERCLNPSLSNTTDLNLSAAYLQAMLHYRKALQERNPGAVTERELQFLSTSAIPLLSFVELAAMPQAVSFSSSYLETYAEAAAYETLLAALSSLADEVRELVSGSGTRDVSAIQAAYAKELETRITELTADIRRREGQLSARLQRVADFIRENEHLRRAVYGKQADLFLQTLPATGK